MKRILAFCLTLALMLCLSSSALAAAQILDEANLFSESEETQLNKLIADFREATGMDFVLVTTSANHGATQQEVADDLYDRGGYGIGEDHSGILYYIDMYDRIPYLSTTGAMIDYINDDRIEAAHEYCHSSLADGNYAGAAKRMIFAIQHYISRGLPRQYSYSESVALPDFKELTGSEIVVCALIGLVVAMLFIKNVEGRYTLKGSTYHYGFRENSDVTMTSSEDTYTHTTTTRTRKADPPSSSGGSRSSSGSSTHRSSSGRSHGGGAGRSF